MKAQVNFNAILFAMLAVIIVMVLIFGVKVIDSLKGNAIDSEVNRFVISLQNMINQVDSYGVGSIKEFNYLLPNKIRKVCLNDGSEINKFVDQEFNRINKYSNKNLYLFPGYSFKLARLSLEENPLCFNVAKGANLELIKRGDGVEINVSNKKVDCSIVSYYGDENEKLDLVFLADNYNHLNEFKEDINQYIYYGFDSVEPFKSNKEKINFYFVNEFRDLGCEDINSNIICDSSKVKELAIRCPNDYIIVLSKNKFYSSLKSTTYNGIITVNTADNKLVMMHEIGHLIGDLADEYIVKGLATVDAPNCDIKPCDKWDGCKYEGCSLSDYYRPTKDSLMRAFGLGHDNVFGFFNEEILNEKLKVYE